MPLHFETKNIYWVNPEDGSLDMRKGRVMPATPGGSIEDPGLPFDATGLTRLDLAIFGHILSPKGVEEASYLSVATGNHRSLLVPLSLVEEKDIFQTQELARKIATLSDREVVQLSIDGLTEVLRRRYPKIRGYSR